MTTTYTFIEQHGHGRAPQRNLKVNEIDIIDHDNHIYRLEVYGKKIEAARMWFNNAYNSSEHVLCARADGSFWVERTEVDLYFDDGEGSFDYDIAMHEFAVRPQHPTGE